MERIKKDDLIKELTAYMDDKLRDADRRRRYEGKKLAEVLPIIKSAPFTSLQIRRTLNNNINLGDVCEVVAKILVKVIDGANIDDISARSANASYARGYDGIGAVGRYEVKSVVFNPSSPIKNNNVTLYVLTGNGLFVYEPLCYDKGERMTASVVNDSGYKLLEWDRLGNIKQVG